jgi:glycosyltransferase involved in cell wall biosynthesis
MAAYNGRRYITAAVESVLGQTADDFEFVIIDDGSTDGTSQDLLRFAAQDRRIRLISRPNRGLTASLNEALSLAQGEFVARMDGDDVCLPQRLAEQLEYLRAHPECVCVGSRVELIDPMGSPIRVSDHKLSHEEIDAELLSGIGWAIVHPVAMMRRSAVSEVGGYREQFRTSQDLDLFLRLGEVGKLANLPDVLLQYRQHFDSVGFRKHQEQWKIKSTIIGQAYARRGLEIPPEWRFRPRLVRSEAEQLRFWAWAALKHGNIEAARQHAMASVRMRPLSPASWRVMYCALRGR